MKHGGAKHVSVHLHVDVDAIELTIVDDGAGFDVKKAWGKGIGLVSMAERLESVDGTLDVQSRPGEGTRLAIRVPFHPIHSVDVAVV
jgi:signal transduction histidine kinase